jgi:hypothetical protein
MIRKILPLLAVLLLTGASFKYGGIKHDITVTAKSAGTTTLTASSTQVQAFTGTSAHTVDLPSGLTLKDGYWYIIANEGATGDIVVRDASSSVMATLTASQSATFYMKDDAVIGGNWSVQKGGGSGSGVDGGSSNALTEDINQTTHGFSVGDLVRLSGAGTYTKSQADSAANAEVEGMVSAVADADNFTLMMKGYVTGLSGLTANTRYFLDASTAGAMTSTPPSTADQVVKYVFVADSTTSGYVDIQPGRVVESQASQTRSVYGVYFGGASEPSACTGSPCTIYRQPGDWLTSVTRNAQGEYDINIKSGIFSAAPVCNCTVVNDSNQFCGMMTSTPPSSTSVRFRAWTAGASLTDNAIAVNCTGI